MARTRLLAGDEAMLFNARITIARATEAFSISELSRSWGIARATAYRYNSHEYRDRSLEDAKREYDRGQEERLALHGRCYRCHEPLINHARCADCTILLHDPESERCQSCIDTRAYLSLHDIPITNYP